MGVVLTGMLDNGTAGLLAVERAGGTTVVQDPADAAFPGMPLSALGYVEADHVIGLRELPTLLARLTAPPEGVAQRSLRPAVSGAIAGGASVSGGELSMDSRETIKVSKDPNTASGFTCPECSGAPWESREHRFSEYICRVGHLFSPETLLEEQAERRDDLLESALRALREEEALNDLLLERGRARGLQAHHLKRHARRGAELHRVGDQLERMLRQDGPPPEGEVSK